MKFDAFICFVIDDKESVAIPLEMELKKNDYKISLIQISAQDIGLIKNKIEKGLDEARYGIIILSESFLKIISHNAELDSFIVKQNVSGEKLILPVWHNVTPEIVEKYLSLLTDWLSATTDKGVYDVVAIIVKAIRPAKTNETQSDGTNLRQSIEKIMKFDAFICFVIDDKESVAIPLERELKKIAYKISLIQISVQEIGLIKNKIEKGLDEARYGIIILSESFLKIISHNAELDSFIIKQNVSGEKMILPVWHNVTPEIVKKHSAALTDWLSATTDNGVDDVAAMIVKAIRPAKTNETQTDATNLRQSIERLFLKQKYTLDLYRTWHSDMIRESRISVSAWVRQFSDVNQMPSLSELRKRGDKIEKHISRLLFYYEQWAIFSKQELIDKELILKLLSSYLVWYHKIFIRPLALANAHDPELSSTLKHIEQEVFSEEMYKFNDLKFY